jgi:cystathionine beta-lyase
LCDFIGKNLPLLKVTRLEGTYLVWVDHSALGITTDELFNRLLNEAHVWVSPGTMYGPQTGEGFIRINIACPRSQLDEALQRIKACLNS